MTLAVAKYLGSSLNNNIIMESESRKEKIQSPSMLLAKGIILLLTESLLTMMCQPLCVCARVCVCGEM